MKKILPTFIIVLMSSLPFPVSANDGANYYLVKVGAMNFQVEEPEGPQPVGALGLTYGVSISEDMSMEFDLFGGVLGGSFKNDFSDSGQYNVFSLATHVAYRLPVTHKYFVKAKAGLAYVNLFIDRPVEPLESNENIHEIAFSFAIAVGFSSVNRFSYELEINRMQSDYPIDYLSLGMNYRF